jgi:hypothetical protein
VTAFSLSRRSETSLRERWRVKRPEDRPGFQRVIDLATFRRKIADFDFAGEIVECS